jgi:hypothetical protein
MSRWGWGLGGRNRAASARKGATSLSKADSASSASCTAPKASGRTVRARMPAHRVGPRLSRSPFASKGAVIPMVDLPKVHDQTRVLYRFLLERVSNFDEFKRLVALYPETLPSGGEPDFAIQIRALLRSRISQWLGRQVDAMTADELLCWRAIVVDGQVCQVAWLPKAYGVC